ncbi:MAG: WD40-repeat-containing domain protein, partial [Benniella sp.]
GSQIATASADNTVRLLDVKTGNGIGTHDRTLNGHSESILCVAIFAEWRLPASGSQDKTVRIWDVALGQCRFVVRNFEGGVHSIA